MTTHVTKNEQAYNRLRRMILGGDFSSGNHWTVRSLAEKIGFSQLTINQALKRLQQDGLIEVRPQSGIALRYVDGKERRELNILRQALEVQAARLLAEKAKTTDLAPIRKIAEKLRDALQQGDFSKANQLDYEFHTSIVKKAGCPPLQEAFERLISICMVTDNFNTAWREMDGKTNCSHLHVISQIATANPDKAQDAIRRHLAAE